MNECFDERLHFLRERELERVLLRKYEYFCERVNFFKSEREQIKFLDERSKYCS